MNSPVKSFVQRYLYQENGKFRAHSTQFLPFPRIRLQDLECLQLRFNLLGNSPLHLVCSYCWKFKFSLNEKCDFVIEKDCLLYSYSRNVQNVSFQYGILLYLQSRPYIYFATRQFEIIDLSFFVTSQFYRRSQIS